MLETIRNYKNLLSLNLMSNQDDIKQKINEIETFIFSSNFYLVKNINVYSAFVDNLKETLIRYENIKTKDMENIYIVSDISVLINILNKDNLSLEVFNKICDSELIDIIKNNDSLRYSYINLLTEIKENKFFENLDMQTKLDIFKDNNLENIYQSYKQNFCDENKKIENMIDFSKELENSDFDLTR